jgi:hypothetical protein
MAMGLSMQAAGPFLMGACLSLPLMQAKQLPRSLTISGQLDHANQPFLANVTKAVVHLGE